MSLVEANLTKNIAAAMTALTIKINGDVNRYIHIKTTFTTGPDDHHRGLELARILEDQHPSSKSLPADMFAENGRHVLVYERNAKKICARPNCISGFIVFGIEMKYNSTVVSNVLHIESFDSRANLLKDLPESRIAEGVHIEGIENQALMDLDEFMLEVVKRQKRKICEIR